ncbi:MAG: hypothetical protein EPN36_14065 [Rhodanobacteraceae bacterium]|nr:MAG: hypothetical protein EPN36_14065 [Rhodanobacteraceae bacterium]
MNFPIARPIPHIPTPDTAKLVALTVQGPPLFCPPPVKLSVFVNSAGGGGGGGGGGAHTELVAGDHAE